MSFARRRNSTPRTVSRQAKMSELSRGLVDQQAAQLAVISKNAETQAAGSRMDANAGRAPAAVTRLRLNSLICCQLELGQAAVVRLAAAHWSPPPDCRGRRRS